MVFSIRRLGAAAALWLLFPCTMLHAQVNVTTFHNDTSRSGVNNQETILTPNNVNSGTFGKLWNVAVDGFVYAQPLYLSSINIGGGVHNVVFISTEHDSVYAMDADSGTIYWQKSLIGAGGTTVASVADLGCHDINTEVGITGTPVIDTSTGTLYVVAKFKLNGAFYQYLHALDVGTGAEKFGGPTQIQGSVAGVGVDSVNGTLAFNSQWENNRAGLLLQNGHVMVAFASHCDKEPWHGWVFSYAAGTLAQEAAYVSSPNGFGDGIWMSAGGLAADSAGNTYFSTGNGSWNGTTDLGDSVVKLGPVASGMAVLDYFTPYNQNDMTTEDGDLAAGGVALMPTTTSGRQLLTTIGKDGKIYLLDRTNLGKYCILLTPACSDSNPQIVEEIPNAFSGMWGTPAVWNDTIYWAGGNDNTGEKEPMKAFGYNAATGIIAATPVSVSNELYGFSGPSPAVSSSGNTNGILWGVDNHNQAYTCVGTVHCQTLVAYDATNLAKLLYTSDQAPNGRDVPGGALKFTTPVIANGKVYVGSAGVVSAYGLLAGAPLAATPTFSVAAGTYATAQSVTLSDTTPGATIYYTTNGTMPSAATSQYSGALTISATTTIRAIAIATGYATSAVASATYTINIPTTQPGTYTSVNLASEVDVNALSTEGSSVADGGIDGLGYAYSRKLLGPSVTWNGSTFAVGSSTETDAALDAVSNATIALTAGNYASINLLATGVRGNQPNQTFIITYTDGTTTSVTQSLSDWYTPQNYPGESTAVTMAYRVAPNGATNPGPLYLYGYSFALNSSKTVKSITLPNNRYVVVLAVDLVAPATASATTQVAFGTAANVAAVFANGNPVTNSGIDGLGNAYTGNLLGASQTWNGMKFNMPAFNRISAVANTTVALTAGSYSSINLLAAGVRGAQLNQTFTITYTDGTTTTATQNLSDWYTPQNYAGESKAVTMGYRVGPTGATEPGPYYLYGYTFLLNSTKTVKSITLPANRYVVVISMTLAGAGAGTGGSASTTPAAVSFGTAANVASVFANGNTVTSGGIDGLGYAYSGNLFFTSTVTWNGTTFNVPPFNRIDAVANTTVTLPAGRYSSLKLLATGVRNNQPAQTLIVTYTDGTTKTLVQSFSDWYTPQNYAGETTAFTWAYRVAPDGTTNVGPYYVYGYVMALDNTKTVASLTLPANRYVVLLAATLLP